MAANKGLGRGLGSLLGLDIDDLTNDTKNSTNSISIEISLADIDTNTEQPRKHFDQQALAELADSIRIHGVIQPIVVTRVGLRFMIIAGERRFRASQLAGKQTIPAIIKNYTKQEIHEISLIENLQREDLNAMEEARGIKRLMNECNRTQEQIGERLSKSRSAIANTLRLLTLTEQVQQLIEDGSLTPGQARPLIVITDPRLQIELAKRAVDDKLTARQMEKIVQDKLNPPTKVEKPPVPSELKQLIANMQRAFATKVSGIGSNTKGRIYIDYYTTDDLDRICKLVNDWNKANNKNIV